MRILTSEQIRKADAFTIANEPIASIDLMERASSVFTDWFVSEFSQVRSIAVFAGIGNNGGDGLAIARLLSKHISKVDVYIVRYSDKSSVDFQVNEKRLSDHPEVTISEVAGPEDLKTDLNYDAIIDALWGSGINRPISGIGSDVIRYLNQMAGIKVAVDIPSGMAGDFKNNSIIFKADHTLSFELPKQSFFFAENHQYAGNWHIRSIGLSNEFIDKQEPDLFYFTHDDAAGLIKHREKFSHKGNNGHSLIVAGSYGKIGAGILASKACLRSGSGLVTLHLPHSGINSIHSACPEVMLSIDQHEYYITHIPDEHKYDAIGIGPGLDIHPETQKALFDLLPNCKLALVIDADALNILAGNEKWMEHIPKDSILTPHPKEFQRLFGETDDDYDRLQRQMRMAVQYGVYIVLKGAHTSIACPDGTCWFNSTGNPALATAGSGDVLTGMITGFLAQGYSSKDSALLGVYLHGLAADLYSEEFDTERMIASDIIQTMNNAISKTYE